jgi:peroxiredoxin Q/BCP
MAQINIGDQAPDFELPVASGEKLRLAALRGRKLVLYFYPKDDTIACTKEAIDFNAMRSEFEKAGARIVGVSPDSVASHVKFARKHDLGLTLASDETRSMLRSYGVWVEKSMYGRKYMGVERATFLIDAQGVVAKVWRKVKTTGHAKEVLAAVKAI